MNIEEKIKIAEYKSIIFSDKVSHEDGERTYLIREEMKSLFTQLIFADEMKAKILNKINYLISGHDNSINDLRNYHDSFKELISYLNENDISCNQIIY